MRARVPLPGEYPARRPQPAEGQPLKRRRVERELAAPATAFNAHQIPAWRIAGGAAPVERRERSLSGHALKGEAP